MSDKKVTYYSPLEEKLNVYSHAFGLGMFLLGTVFLVLKALEKQSTLYLVTYLVYGLSLVTLYGASTFYHKTQKEDLRRKLNILDHAAIYCLIAGTYIPVCLVGIGGQWGFWLTVVVTVIGIAGIILKLFFTGRFKVASTLSYVGMGCVVFVAIKPLVKSVPRELVDWLFLGGAFYIVGAILYSIKRIPMNHAIFHFFVLAGSFCHFISIYYYL